jgi:hypothetical protein
LRLKLIVQGGSAAFSVDNSNPRAISHYFLLLRSGVFDCISVSTTHSFFVAVVADVDAKFVWCSPDRDKGQPPSRADSPVHRLCTIAWCWACFLLLNPPALRLLGTGLFSKSSVHDAGESHMPLADHRVRCTFALCWQSRPFDYSMLMVPSRSCLR